MITEEIFNDNFTIKSDIFQNQNSIPLDLVNKDEIKFADIFLCKICNKIPLDIYQCSTKGNIYCLNCLNKNNGKCPFNCKNCQKITLPDNDKKVLNLIKFKCPYYKRGCLELLNYTNFRSHFNSCEYGQIFECNQCKNFIGPKKNCFKHLKLHFEHRIPFEEIKEEKKQKTLEDFYLDDDFINSSLTEGLVLHEHDLHFTNIFENECIICKQSFSKFNNISKGYICHICNVGICAKCHMKLRNIIKKYKIQHTLILSNDYYFNCMGCKRNIFDYHITCSSCSKYLCLDCYNKKQFIGNEDIF